MPGDIGPSSLMASNCAGAGLLLLRAWLKNGNGLLRGPVAVLGTLVELPLVLLLLLLVARTEGPDFEG